MVPLILVLSLGELAKFCDINSICIALITNLHDEFFFFYEISRHWIAEATPLS